MKRLLSLGMLCLSIVSLAQCPIGFDRKIVQGNKLSTSRQGEKICLDGDLQLDKLNVRHTGVHVYVPKGREISIAGILNLSQSSSGFKLETEGVLTFDASFDCVSGSRFDFVASGGGRLIWASEANSIQGHVRYTAAASSSIVFTNPKGVSISGESVSRKAELNIGTDASISIAGDLVLAGNTKLDNGHYLKVDGDFGLKNDHNSIYNDCGESNLMVSGTLSFPKAKDQIVVNGGEMRAGVVSINSNSNAIEMMAGAELVAERRFENHTSNALRYTGGASQCATITLLNNSYSVNYDLTTDSSLKWCCPECFPHPSRLGKAVKSCVDCKRKFGSRCNDLFPIEFGFVNARDVETGALIHWTTVQDISTSHFMLMKSVDGAAYQQIVTIPAESYAFEEKLYEYFDSAHKGVDTRYRVVAVDYDGSKRTSDVAPLTKWELDVFVFPNPTRGGQIHMTFSHGTKVDFVHLFDAMGRNVEIDVKHERGGLLLQPWDKIPQGSYFLTAQVSKGMITRKVNVY